MSDVAERMAQAICETLSELDSVIVYVGPHKLHLKDAWPDEEPGLLIGKGPNGEDVTIATAAITAMYTSG